MNIKSKYTGNDNYGRPKQQYIQKLSEMDSEQLSSECYQMIYHSARCNNNPKADWHWMVDACYDESEKRDVNASIYVESYNRCYKDCTGKDPV